MKKVFTFLLPFFPIIITFWLYFPVLNGHFNWEDGMVIGDAIKASTQGNFKYLFTPWYGGYARLLWQIISYVFYNLFGYNAQPFLILILFLHCLNCLLTFLLAKKLTKSSFIAFFASLFYGVYQINSSSIFWISSGIKDIPMNNFSLLSFLFFCSFREKSKIKFLFLSYLSFFLSLSSEFKAILSFSVMGIYDLFYSKKFKLKNEIFVFSPFALIIIFLLLTFYNQTPAMFAGAKNWDFWQTFPTSLSFYYFPISRLFWLRIYSDAHNLTIGQTDEVYLKEFGFLVLFFILLLCVFLYLRKEKEKAKLIILLLFGVFINYLPVIMTVLSRHHSLWNVITVHWRYFLLASPLGAIMAAGAVVYLNDEFSKIFNKILILRVLFLSRIFPTALLGTLIFFHIQFNRVILSGYYYNWTFKIKDIFTQIKKDYASFPKESIFVFEGAEDENKFPYFQHRYLFDNVFALYANPNNPNYLAEQKSLPFEPTEGSNRKLKRLLYYTNIKDFLVGNHYHLYREGDEITFITTTLPWNLPARDRLFLGVIYGYYDPEKIIDFKFLENGTIVNVTEERKSEVKNFLRFYCFENGIKKCIPTKKQYDSNPLIINTMASFSLKGKNIIEFLTKYPNGKIPKIEEIPKEL